MRKKNGLKFINIAPEKALQILRDQATKGYLIRWRVEGNVFKNDTFSNFSSKRQTLDDTKEQDYKEKLNNWGLETTNKLIKIFASKIESFKFTYAGVDIKKRILHSHIDHVRDELIAKLGFLESLIDLIMTRFDIHLTAGRDIHVQIGKNSKMKVSNKKVIKK